MTVSVNTIAQQLRLSPEELIQRSLASFLDREKRTVQMDIADLQDRYRTRSSADLRTRIENGEIYSHPAWEEAIEWEQLEAYLDHLQTLLDALEQ
ncbi:MAG TPA: hypothetical protein PKZ84_21780 [Anaerolineae bacterium]|nr:hypothetical protein [Anaerolineae bacterium]HQI87063.1 hypothetical protein [Anaerolineae bacterium]